MALPVQSGDPVVIQVVRRHRLDLIAREDAQIKRMAASWFNIEQSLNDEMQLLAQDIQVAILNQDVITEQLLRRMNRYQRLKEQMRTRVLHYVNDKAIPDIKHEQMEYGNAAIDTALDVLRLAGDLGAKFDRLPKDAVETYVGLLGDGTPLYRLLKEAYPDALDGVIKSFLNDASKGLSPIQMANNASQQFGLGLERITLIARTEQLRVNRLVSSEQYRASGLDGVMRRVAVKDNRACMACIASDGEIIELDKELDDHPRGRCVAIFQVKGANIIEWEKGRHWFNTLDEQTQRNMMGDKKYELWKRNVFDITDLRRTNFDPTWGNSPRVATLEELLEGRNYSSLVSDDAPAFIAPVVPDIVEKEIDLSALEKEVRESDNGTIKVKAAEGDIVKGAFDSERVTIVGNGDAIIKTNTASGGWGDYDLTKGFAQREVTAYEIDQLLNLNVVPKTTPFIEGGEYKSMQLWVDNATLGRYVSSSDTVSDITSPGRLALLDAITGNLDRHGSNWLLANGKVYAIDNGLGITSVHDDIAFGRFLRDIVDAGNSADFLQQSYFTNDKLLLDKSYRIALQKAIKDGSLKKVLFKAAIGYSDTDAALINAAIKRAKKLIKEWDTYFYDK